MITDRAIHALFYALGGVLLGILIAIQWSYFIDTHTSSVLIILITSISSALFGFFFPHSIAQIYRAFWTLFK